MLFPVTLSASLPPPSLTACSLLSACLSALLHHATTLALALYTDLLLSAMLCTAVALVLALSRPAPAGCIALLLTLTAFACLYVARPSGLAWTSLSLCLSLACLHLHLLRRPRLVGGVWLLFCNLGIHTLCRQAGLSFWAAREMG